MFLKSSHHLMDTLAIVNSPERVMISFPLDEYSVVGLLYHMIVKIDTP